MGTSKLKIYQNACLVLKEAPLSTVTDDVLIRYKFDLCYDDAVQGGLEEGFWNFATRSVAIEHSTDVEPSFGFNFAFEKPDDWVRTSAISGNASYFPPIGPEGYADETTNWHADFDPLFVSYVSNDTMFGLNLANWTDRFARYVAHELAYRVAGHVTGMNAAEKEQLKKDTLQLLKDARAKDAMNEATKSMPPGRLVMSRRGNSSRYPGNWYR